MAIEAVEGYRLGPIFTPPMWDGTVQRPSADGGANWSGAAFDPETGILYVPSTNAYSVMQCREPLPGEARPARGRRCRWACLSSSRPTRA